MAESRSLPRMSAAATSTSERLTSCDMCSLAACRERERVLASSDAGRGRISRRMRMRHGPRHEGELLWRGLDRLWQLALWATYAAGGETTRQPRGQRNERAHHRIPRWRRARGLPALVSVRSSSSGRDSGTHTQRAHDQVRASVALVAMTSPQRGSGIAQWLEKLALLAQLPAGNRPGTKDLPVQWVG